ncbi:hypothetical protein SPFM10_00252 [Salmonella phage SPFM10]|nr:hypothetical protein SPFM10_00252 [Salmonella phage SPFM10]
MAEALANNSKELPKNANNAKVKFVKQALNNGHTVEQERANMLAMDIQGTSIEIFSTSWKEVKDQFHVDHTELSLIDLVEADAKAVPVFDMLNDSSKKAQAAFLGMCQQGKELFGKLKVTEAIAHEELKAFTLKALDEQAVFIESTEFLSGKIDRERDNPRKDARDFVKAMMQSVLKNPTPNCKRIITMSRRKKKPAYWVTVPHDAS